MGAAAIVGAGAGLNLMGGITNLFMQNAAANSQLAAIDSQVRAKQSYYGYIANTLDENAKLAELSADRNAHEVNVAAGYQKAAMIDKNRELAGSQLAAVAANGISSGSATAEDITRDTARQQRLDMMALDYNASAKATAIKLAGKTDAYNFRTQAAGQRLAGVNAAYEGNIEKASIRQNRTSSLLGGAFSIASNGLNSYSRLMEYA